jgi:hypothetical protein
VLPAGGGYFFTPSISALCALARRVRKAKEAPRRAADDDLRTDRFRERRYGDER